jgi:hypothetical protein
MRGASADDPGLPTMIAQSVITNHSRDFQLLNLAPERGHPEQRGPFLIAQEGAAPNDPHQRHCAFYLTRRGTWVHQFLAFHLAPLARRELVEFDTAAEALTISGNLLGAPVVETLDSLQAWLRELHLDHALDLAGVEAARAKLQAQQKS